MISYGAYKSNFIFDYVVVSYIKMSVSKKKVKKLNPTAKNTL